MKAKGAEKEEEEDDDDDEEEEQVVSISCQVLAPWMRYEIRVRSTCACIAGETWCCRGKICLFFCQLCIFF